MSGPKMSDTYYCENCGGVAWGKVTLTSDFKCRCGVPTTFTEWQRDEFAVNYGEWLQKTGAAPTQFTLDQYKATLL